MKQSLEIARRREKERERERNMQMTAGKGYAGLCRFSDHVCPGIFLMGKHLYLTLKNVTCVTGRKREKVSVCVRKRQREKERE